MNHKEKSEIQDFPSVPDCVHQVVLDALKEIGTVSMDREKIEGKKSRRYKKHVVLLAAAMMITILATTALASEFFSWNKRAEELFGSDKELQDKLVEEEIAKDEFMRVTDNGLTICAIQTIQDANCFYALFEVKSEDSSILLDNNSEMDILFDWGGEENPFIAIENGFVGGEEKGNSRMYEIFGTKAERDSKEDLQMNLHFSALRQWGEKAMKGKVVLEGNWDFSLNLHQTEGISYSIEKEFFIAGYPVWVHQVVMSPISITIICDGDDIKEMEKGEGICLDQLDVLYPMLFQKVKYEDGSMLDEKGSTELVEGFKENGNYYKMIRLSNIVEVEKVVSIFVGEQMDEIVLK